MNFTPEKIERWALAYLHGNNVDPADVPAVEHLSSFLRQLDWQLRRSIEPIYVPGYEPYGFFSDDPLPAMRNHVSQGYLLVARSVPAEMHTFTVGINNAFRFAHDVLQHVQNGYGFDMEGEYRSFLDMNRRWVQWAAQQGLNTRTVLDGSGVLFSEMVLQIATSLWLGGYDQERDGLRYSQKLVLDI